MTLYTTPADDGMQDFAQSIENFKARIEEFVRDGLITREPVKGQGIAVKYINDPLQSIALAELDRQGK